jgi:hypothetical protein
VSLVTVSTKRSRIYQRDFDHDLAIAFRAEGWSYPRLAEHFDVSEAAIARVVRPGQRERMDAQSKRWVQRNRRPPCRGGCGRLVWLMNKERSGYCTRCAAARKTTGVRPTELRCSSCGEWKPDEAFYKRSGAWARRERAPDCKSCSNDHRRTNRHRNAERERNYTRERRRKEREDRIMATFIVYQPNGKGMTEVGRIDASSADQAIEKLANEPGDYAAIAAHRFEVVTVRPVNALRVVRDQDTAPA